MKGWTGPGFLLGTPALRVDGEERPPRKGEYDEQLRGLEEKVNVQSS